MTRRIVISTLLVLLILAGCSTPEPTPTPVPTVAPTPTPITRSTQIPRISPEDLKERLDNGEDIVIGDTRGKSSYEIKHIAGAISISSSVDDSLNKLAWSQEIVLYCSV
jgi:hypothetical protein